MPANVPLWIASNRKTGLFFERIRQCYLARAAQEPSRFRTVDAGQPLGSVQQQLGAIVEEMLAWP